MKGKVIDLEGKNYTRAVPILIGVLVVIGVLSISLSALAQTTVQIHPYRLIPVGQLPGIAHSQAFDINDNNEVVGWSRGGKSLYYGWIWQSGVLTQLPTFGGTKGTANKLNNNGQIVGEADATACLWEYDPVFGWLITNLASQGFTQAQAISDSGIVVGSNYNASNKSLSDCGLHAAKWDSVTGGATIEDLGTLGGAAVAYNINSSDVIVGTTQGRAVKWEAGSTTPVSVGTLPGSCISMAYDVNASGQMAVQILGWPGRWWDYWAARYDPLNGGWEYLGTLTAGGWSKSWAINDDGVVVGDSQSLAFVHLPGVGMLNLNNLLTADSPTGWTLQRATGINSNGYICGYGANASALQEGFVLEPVTTEWITVTKPDAPVWGAPPVPEPVTITNNILVNGDFETGDLTGWKKAGSADYPWWTGNQPTPPHAYSDSSGLPYYLSASGVPTLSGDVGPPPSVGSGNYSAGFGTAGNTTNEMAWIAQRFTGLQPGRYIARANWDVSAHHTQNWLSYPEFGSRRAFHRVYLYVDGQVDNYKTPATLEIGADNWLTGQDWVSRGFELEITTYQGQVEIRFAKRDDKDHFYEWVSYDNCEFELELVEAYVPATNIDEAKQKADNYPAELSGVIVTSQIYNDTGAQTGFTVETPDRSSGIRVATTTATPFVGDEVDIEGQLATVSGERIINATSATTTGFPGAPGAFSIAGIDTGGGAYGVQGAVVNDAASDKYAVGMNNVGVLMKLTGKVTAVVEADPLTPSFNDYFYVDDAYGDAIAGFETGLKDGSGNIGIKCRRAPSMFGGPGTVPAVGDYVDVAGVMGVQQIGGKNARFMWTKSWTAANSATFNRNHVAQWSLLSLPAQPKFPDPAVVFGSPDKIDGRLYRWDAPTQSLGMYDMWSPDLFGAMNSSEGYWLNAAAAGTISYTGYTESTSLDRWISAPAGWKLMGNPFTTNTQWANWSATDGSAMKSIENASQYGSGWMQSIGYWWNDSTQSLSDLGLPDDFPQSEELNTWYGYWVKTGKNLGLVAPH